jgi:hypothetical protein
MPYEIENIKTNLCKKGFFGVASCIEIPTDAYVVKTALESMDLGLFELYTRYKRWQALRVLRDASHEISKSVLYPKDLGGIYESFIKDVHRQYILFLSKIQAFYGSNFKTE